jgi:hypothetical protein
MIARTVIDRSHETPIVAYRFDDNHTPVFEYVYPLLAKYGIKGTLCFGPDHIEASATPQPVDDSNGGAGAYLIPAQIKELMDAGWAWCLHPRHSEAESLTVAHYPNVGDLQAAIEAEYQECVQILQDYYPTWTPAMPDTIVYFGHILERALVPELIRTGFEYGTSVRSASGADFDGDYSEDFTTTRTHREAMQLASRRSWDGRLSLSPQYDLDNPHYSDLAVRLHVCQGVCSVLRHCYGDYGGANWADETWRDAELALMEAQIIEMIGHGTVFCMLPQLLRYWSDPTNPHLQGKFRQLLPRLGYYDVSRPTILIGWANGTLQAGVGPTGEPVMKQSSEYLSVTAQTVRTNRFYMFRVWAKNSDEGDRPRPFYKLFSDRAGANTVKAATYFPDATGKDCPDWTEIVGWIDTAGLPVTAISIQLRQRGTPLHSWYASDAQLFEMPAGAVSGDVVRLPGETAEYVVGTAV